MVFSDPGSSDSKESTCSAGTTGDPGWIPGLGRSLKKEMATHSGTLASKIPGERNLMGYSPWGHRVGHDLATKQQQSFTVFIHPGVSYIFHLQA